MPSPPPSITLAEAASTAGLTPEELANLIAEVLAERREQTGDPDWLLPFQRHRDTWPHEVYRVWALKMGLWRDGPRGTRVIGFAGMAWITGLTPQYLRKLRSTAARSLSLVRPGTYAPGLPEDLPEPVNASPVPGGQPVFWDMEVFTDWARMTGRLKRPYPFLIPR